MINRSAVIVRPTQPYIDWATGLDDSGMVPPDDDERTVYLLPSDEDDIDGAATIARAWELIFEAELEHWHLIMEDWPTDRTLAGCMSSSKSKFTQLFRTCVLIR